MNRMVGQVCTVEVGIAAIKGNGVKCQRRAVLEITERGIHSGWRCALHATDWKDENGQFHISVYNDFNMIPGLLPNTSKCINNDPGAQLRKIDRE